MWPFISFSGLTSCLTYLTRNDYDCKQHSRHKWLSLKQELLFSSFSVKLYLVAVLFLSLRRVNSHDLLSMYTTSHRDACQQTSSDFWDLRCGANRAATKRKWWVCAGHTLIVVLVLHPGIYLSSLEPRPANGGPSRSAEITSGVIVPDSVVIWTKSLTNNAEQSMRYLVFPEALVGWPGWVYIKPWQVTPCFPVKHLKVFQCFFDLFSMLNHMNSTQSQSFSR